MIALDWGTSSFRAWLLDGECGVLDSIHSGLGILKISDGRFEEVFEEQLDSWFESYGHKQALMKKYDVHEASDADGGSRCQNGVVECVVHVRVASEDGAGIFPVEDEVE